MINLYTVIIGVFLGFTTILMLLLIILVTFEVIADLFGKKYKQPFVNWPKKSNENKDEGEV